MTRDLRGTTLLLVASTLVATMLYAPTIARAEQGTTLATWTMQGSGYCVQGRIISYSGASLTEGDIFQWLATSELCDPGASPGVGMLRLQASVRTPKSGPYCSWPSQTFSGGSAIATSSSPGGAGAASYYEWGDGTSPPPDAVGVSVGRTPEALGVCSGTWRIAVASYILPSTSGAWIKLGTAAARLDVARSPAHALARPEQSEVDHTLTRGTLCVHQHFEFYDTSPTMRVGDLLEYSDVHETCDAPGTPLLYALKQHDTLSPPSGCPARSWLLQGPDGAVGGGGATSIKLFAYQYGDGEPPPDLDTNASSGGGRPAMIWVNCPGSWTLTIISRVWTTQGGPWVTVGRTVRTLEVLPHV